MVMKQWYALYVSKYSYPMYYVYDWSHPNPHPYSTAHSF